MNKIWFSIDIQRDNGLPIALNSCESYIFSEELSCSFQVIIGFSESDSYKNGEFIQEFIKCTCSEKR